VHPELSFLGEFLYDMKASDNSANGFADVRRYSVTLTLARERVGD
jgi:hypothetical protein